jgi:hypothetical protein
MNNDIWERLRKAIPSDLDEEGILKLPNVRDLFEQAVSLRPGPFSSLTDFKIFTKMCNLPQFDSSFKLPDDGEGCVFVVLIRVSSYRFLFSQWNIQRSLLQTLMHL